MGDAAISQQNRELRIRRGYTIAAVLLVLFISWQLFALLVQRAQASSAVAGRAQLEAGPDAAVSVVEARPILVLSVVPPGFDFNVVVRVSQPGKPDRTAAASVGYAPGEGAGRQVISSDLRWSYPEGQ